MERKIIQALFFINMCLILGAILVEPIEAFFGLIFISWFSMHQTNKLSNLYFKNKFEELFGELK